MNELRQVLQVCPQVIVRAVSYIPQREAAGIEEIRLRNGQFPSYLRNDKEKALSHERINGKDLQEVIDRASENSAYAVQDMLKNGFLTLRGGHRIGLCGRGVYRQGEIQSLRDVSSVNIRIARQIWGVADQAVNFIWTHPRSTLILAPPGRGKTTLLRDLIRQLSERFTWRICVVDERLEIGACVSGVPQLSLGTSTDILSGIFKAEAINMLLRSMNPQWIALDEITAAQDIEAICQASYCGVRFLATAHAASIQELRERPIYRQLLVAKVFQNIITINPARTLQMEVISND